MKKIEAPYLLFALIFGFMALISPYLMEEHRLTLEGRVAMLLFQAAMMFACSLSSAKHLHDKWVQQEINDRQARLRMPKPQEDGEAEAVAAGNASLSASADTAQPAHEVGAVSQPVAPGHEHTSSSASGSEAAGSDVAVSDAAVKPPAT